MSTTDLLVPLSCIPEVLPLGLTVATIHNVDGEHLLAQVITDLPEAEWSIRIASAGGTTWTNRLFFALDLSAPPTDAAGAPLRMDAFAWAVGTMRRRGQDEDSDEYDPLTDIAGNIAEMCTYTGGRISMTARWCRWMHAGPPAWWPDLPDASDDTCARTILAAALRARVGLPLAGET